MAVRAAALAGAKPTVASSQQFKQAYADLVEWRKEAHIPVVYHPDYNITFGGIERLHPFDSCKFKKVLHMLSARNYLTEAQTVRPIKATKEVLADVHTKEYIDEVHSSSWKVAEIVGLAPIAFLPSPLVKRCLISPMRYHVSGTMVAAALALENGWSINLGGGMHHAHRFDGDGWCPFDDIMLAVRRIRKASGGQVQRVMVIDTDAHQGNGVARDKLHFKDGDLFILDVYNCRNYPMDEPAKAGIDVRVELAPGTKDEAYLRLLQEGLTKAGASGFRPDLIIYNAGTDTYELDPLGRLGLSAAGIVQRDRMVWDFAVSEQRAPICMLLSGGYAKDSARIIADSIAALFDGLQLLVRDGAAGGEVTRL